MRRLSVTKDWAGLLQVCLLMHAPYMPSGRSADAAE